ncbi:MAG: arginine--tRNA ligase [Saprospirales bacterium]|nr:MAG: arginine--tRNA ligase [Saprospirales bacterium]
MHLYAHISSLISDFFSDELKLEIESSKFQFTPTKKEFDGDYTLVVFPLVRHMKKKPEECGEIIGQYLLERSDYVEAFNVVKGFLNLSLSTTFWRESLELVSDPEKLTYPDTNKGKLVLEYSSPNTNKPLHLGHIRNILIGWSMYRILQRVGYEVIKTQIVNDRGVAICKSMLAWKKFAGGETPESSGKKGDHLIGEYYVTFDKALKEEYEQWQTGAEAEKIFREKNDGKIDRNAFFKKWKNEYFNEKSQLGAEVRQMLRDWEDGDPNVIALWEKMNAWVYAGFDETYAGLGVDFDKTYFESDTYKLGKDIVEEGLQKGIFYKMEDGSIWVDLSDSGMDQKLLLRSDGTSVYITQDLGTARIRYEDYKMGSMVYVVGNEQDYHFQVLFEVLKLLGEPYADGLLHLSYGMVDLPTGKMKSREGTVVDADDLMAEVVEIAAANVEDRGAMDELSEEERREAIRRIGMGALKFQLLKVNPKKRMVFNPEESVDLQGHTGPYIQNAYVRILSVLRKAGDFDQDHLSTQDYFRISGDERELIQMLLSYREVIERAAGEFDPAHLAGFSYQLARAYHRFYHDHQIIRAESEAARNFRLKLSVAVAAALEDSLSLLGIAMPVRM